MQQGLSFSFFFFATSNFSCIFKVEIQTLNTSEQTTKVWKFLFSPKSESWFIWLDSQSIQTWGLKKDTKAQEPRNCILLFGQQVQAKSAVERLKIAACKYGKES